MLRWLYMGMGGLAILAGALIFWLPVPIGLPLILLGLPLVTRHSPWARERVLGVLRQWPRLDRLFAPLLVPGKTQAGRRRRHNQP